MMGPDLMLALARSDTSVDRERLLMAIAELCQNSGDCSGAAIQGLLQDIFMDVVKEAERDFRLRLAVKLAPAGWAPRALVLALARDEIEIARPVITQSPLLQNPDLIRLLVEASIEHQIEVARRPRLDAEVVGAILDQGDADVLAALANNISADISTLSMQRLVSFSERMAALRGPVARHPKLTVSLAGLLYRWVGESLRQGLSERFEADEAALKQAIARTVEEYRGVASAEASPSSLLDEREAMDRRMVEKLAAAGQLRAGLLIRALHEGKLGLFKAGLAALAGLSADSVSCMIDAEDPDELASSCGGIGIDHTAFKTVLSLVRALNKGRPGLGSAGKIPAANTRRSPPRHSRI